MADLVTPNPPAELYESDFLLWADAQARLVRAQGERGAAGFDWDHVAEELEALAGAQRRELYSRVQTILEHLLKLQHSPAADPRWGWLETVERERGEIVDLLDLSPSLRRLSEEAIRRTYPRAVRLARLGLERHGEQLAAPEACPYTAAQVLGNWFPPTPPG